MLHDLGSPTGLGTCVEPLSRLEAKGLQDLDEQGESGTRTAKGVMVVIGPAEAQAVLSCLLDLAGSIAALPMSPLGCESDPGCGIPTHLGDQFSSQSERLFHASPLVVEPTGTGRPALRRIQITHRIVGRHSHRQVPGVPAPFDNQELLAIRFPGHGATVGAEDSALDRRRDVMHHQKPGDFLDLNRGCNYASRESDSATAQHDPWQNRTRMLKDCVVR